MDALLTFLEDPATPLGIADILWIFYLLYGLIRGSFRGLPRELAGLLGTVISFYCGWKFYGPVSSAIRENTRLESPTGSALLAYVLLILVFFVSWKLITFLLKKTLDWTCPHQLQQWGGGLLGVIKCLLVMAVILTAINLSGFESVRTPMIRHSWFGRTTQQVIPGFLHETFPSVFPEPVYDDGVPAEEPQSEQTEEADGSGDT